MHKREPAPEFETHKILRDFELQADYLIQATGPNLEIIKKKEKRRKKRTCRLADFSVPVDHSVKIK